MFGFATIFVPVPPVTWAKIKALAAPLLFSAVADADPVVSPTSFGFRTTLMCLPVTVIEGVTLASRLALVKLRVIALCAGPGVFAVNVRTTAPLVLKSVEAAAVRRRWAIVSAENT